LTKKKQIILVEASPAYGNSYFLPYAVGTLAAYAFSHEHIRESYALDRIIYRKDKIDDAIASMDEPYLVGFSCSVWNAEYNKLFARKLKEKFPKCAVVFGGHSVPKSNAWLEEYGFIDYLIHVEGEEPFYGLLNALDRGASLQNIPNLSYRGESGAPVMNPVLPNCRVDYPSPFLEGIFDGIMNGAEPGVVFQTIIETTRGCPYRCTYCDWDTLKTRARPFPMERIKAEIEWSAARGIEFFCMADSNFGIHERDSEIIDYVLKLRDETGYPKRFQTCFAKDDDERVFEINKKLSAAGISRSATISFQSMSREVLKNIGRANISTERFKEMMSRYNALNIPTYSELILGLPGETVDSFKAGLTELLDMGQHATVFVHNCDLLPNSIMDDPEYGRLHGIKSVVTPMNKYHCEFDENEEATELSRTVIGSKTMDVADWIRASLYANCVQCFHAMGLLRCFAVYLRYEKNAGYTEFYSSLLDWIESDENRHTAAHETYTVIRNILEKFTRAEGVVTYYDPKFSKVIWRHEEGAFLELVSRQEQFYSEIGGFLERFGIEGDMYADLMAYQRGILKLPDRVKTDIPLGHDLHAYFKRIYVNDYAPPEKIRNTLHIEDTEPVDNWADYAKYAVWFGRKSGKTLNGKVKTEYND